MITQSIQPSYAREFAGSSDLRTSLYENNVNWFRGSTETKMASCLDSVALGPARLVWSSSASKSLGVLLERHEYSPGERREAAIDKHVISMSRSSPARFEYRNLSGEFTTVVLRPKAIMITPSGKLPDIRLHTQAEFTHCALEDDFIRRVATELNCATQIPTFRPGVEERSIECILGLLTQEMQAADRSDRLYIDSLIYALTARYLTFDVGRPKRSKSSVAGLLPRILNRIRSKIEASLDTDLTLEALAQESGYSRAHFLRMFQAATGLTPHQYVLDVRLKRARERLSQANSSIIDVALSCGFSSQSHMTSVFRRCLNTTPGEFRRSVLS